MITPTLLAEARTLIARLELVSHGTTTSYDSDGRGGAYDSRAPVTGHTRAPRPQPGVLSPPMIGATDPEFLVLRRRLANARTDTHVEAIIGVARRELNMAQKTPQRQRVDRKQIVLYEFEGEDYRQVAEVVGVHCTTVWRWRTAMDLQGVDGRPVAA